MTKVKPSETRRFHSSESPYWGPLL